MKELIRTTVLALLIGASLFLTNNMAFGQTDLNDFKPFNVAVSRFTVNDYDKWRNVFDEDRTVRKSIGMSNIAVGQSIYNPSNLVTAFVIDDVEKVKAYVGSIEFQEKAIKAGLGNNQLFHFLEVIRFIPGESKIGFLYYVIKVKDIDQWLKTYDMKAQQKD
jgi:hypothetical protein